jgi:hypothetical protein
MRNQGSDAMIAAIDDGLRRQRMQEPLAGQGATVHHPEFGLSQHASKRVQQRAIPPIVIEWLTRFGVQKWSRGASIYAFDKEGRRRLRQHIGQRLFGSIEHWLDAYVVVGGGQQVVTVGWRQQKRHV